jgi:exodeoxyribonuclease VII large subunit
MSENKLVLTPAAVNKYIKSILETDKYLKTFYLAGEISNLKNHSSMNIYFSIKDNEAQINCVMFKNHALNLGFKPTDGMKVEIKGAIYENVKSGMYSINVSNMQQLGIGNLAEQFNQLKNKLLADGLFDQAHKLPIKRFNKKIGVITSPTSAAVRDIITTIKRRDPHAQIIIIPTLVQGKNAATDIVKNIMRAHEIPDLDILIVGRGGGSIEDLWAFNEEIVAHCVYDATIPIISCIGHETDTTIIDFVADLRAPTPTAAAELATIDLSELNLQMNNNIKNITKIIEDKIKYQRMRIERLTANQYFINPLLQKQLTFDQLNFALFNQGKNLLTNVKQKESNINNKLELIKSQEINILKNKTLKLNSLHQQLDNLNPLSILSRGYSFATVDNQLIKSIENVQVNDELIIRVKDGNILSRVINKEPNE